MNSSNQVGAGGRDLPPSDTQRDLALGDALRSALDARGEAAFVSRVLANLDAPRPVPAMWDWLAGWARRGIPVTLGLTALAVLFLSLRTGPVGTLDDVLAGSQPDVAATILAGSVPPGSGVLFQEPNDR